MRTNTRSLLAVSTMLAAAPALASVTFYQGEGFTGRAFGTSRAVVDFDRAGFNDSASSVIVDRGRWVACEDARFEGRCVLLRPGNYDSLRALGMNNRISSVRPANARGARYDTMPDPGYAPVYDYRQRPSERLFEADVTSVRAVMGPPEQRCWVERHEVRQPNVGGAILGGIIGGVLGHQVGSGRGNDAATAAGAVAGAAIGSGAGAGHSRDVRRCETTEGPVAYFDVSYRFRGVEHHAQLNRDPGPTITVNREGVPRG